MRDACVTHRYLGSGGGENADPITRRGAADEANTLGPTSPPTAWPHVSNSGATLRDRRTCRSWADPTGGRTDQPRRSSLRMAALSMTDHNQE